MLFDSSFRLSSQLMKILSSSWSTIGLLMTSHPCDRWHHGCYFTWWWNDYFLSLLSGHLGACTTNLCNCYSASLNWGPWPPHSHIHHNYTNLMLWNMCLDPMPHIIVCSEKNGLTSLPVLITSEWRASLFSHPPSLHLQYSLISPTFLIFLSSLCCNLLQCPAWS